MPAPTFQNLGFEAAGTAPGSAASWTSATRSSAEEIAGFGPAPEQPQDGFERGWPGVDTFAFALAPEDVEPSLFDEAPESIEDFEEGWSQNEAFLHELASIVAADYDPGSTTKSMEDFGTLWAGNEAFAFSFAPGDLAGIPTDTFESGWRSNQAFQFSLATGDLALAGIDTFESDWSPMATI